MAVIFTSAVFASMLCGQTAGSSHDLELGIRAHESGDYPEAIEHLERAVLIDPASADAHYYLGSAYAWLCPDENPGGDPSCDSALREYNRALEINPRHKEALKSLGYLLHNMARKDEAEAMYRRAAQVDENDPQALYSIAVIVFLRTYRDVNVEKHDRGLRRGQPLIQMSVCRELRAKYLAGFDEGLELLTRAAAVSNSFDVQGYLGASYSERAELQCDDRAAYNRDRAASKRWWNQACLTFHNTSGSFLTRWLLSPHPPPSKRGDACKW
jgi:tetratricopeptide (TPR) repeat protein